MAVARLGAGQRILSAFRLCDVEEGSDGSDEVAVDAKRAARDRDVSFFARHVIDDARFVALWLAGQNPVFARGDVGPLSGRHLVCDRLSDDVADRPARVLRAGEMPRALLTRDRTPPWRRAST